MITLEHKSSVEINNHAPLHRNQVIYILVAILVLALLVSFIIKSINGGNVDGCAGFGSALYWYLMYLKQSFKLNFIHGLYKDMTGRAIKFKV